MKKIIYLLITVLLFSSCAGGLYSHYPKVKRHDNMAMQGKENRHAKKLGATPENYLSQKIILIPSTTVPVKITKNIETPTIQKKTINKPAITNIPGTIQSLLNKNETKTTLSAKSDEPAKHPGAKSSMVLSIVGWGVAILTLIPYIGVFFGLAALILEIIALVKGITALNDIKENPEKYSGKENATTGVVLSSIYLGLVVLFIFIFLLIAIAFLI